MHKHLMGIVQGRLTQPPDNSLQYFPQDNWREEFPLASSIGLDYIEFFAERIHNPQNPIWSKEGLAEIVELCRVNDLTPHAICNDYVIDNSLTDQDDSIDQTIHLMMNASSIGIKNFILPLMEKSEITKTNFEEFRDPLQKIAREAEKQSILVCLETLLDGPSLVTFLKKLGLSNVRVCFDTGNRAALGQNLEADISLLNQYICHVHIKDKNIHNQNVFLGTGEVNFHTAIKAIQKIGYQGGFTFETFRGRDPLATAQFHNSLVQFYLHELSSE